MLLCVSFSLTNQVWNYFEYFLCKTYFVNEILKGECLKILIFGKLGLKLVFWNSISSHSYAFYSLYSMLYGVFSKIRLFFSKILFFHIFDWSNLFLINRKFLKNFRWASVCFNWSKLLFNQLNIVNQFFLKKNKSWPFQTQFFKSF